MQESKHPIEVKLGVPELKLGSLTEDHCMGPNLKLFGISWHYPEP